MRCKANIPKFSLILVGVVVCAFFMYSFDSYYFPVEEHHHYIYIDVSKAIGKTDDEFLSVALDTSFIRKAFHKLNPSNWELLAKLARTLSPAYIRLGGTAADQVLFILNENQKNELQNSDKYEIFMTNEDLSPTDYLNISGHDWLKFMNFIDNSHLRLLLDLNVLLRNGTHWDSTNAYEFLSFADSHDMDMDFQLGNEPNSFQHVFNLSITGIQLGRDFECLRKLLSSWKRFNNSKLIGPDITRPKFVDQPSLHYLKDFLTSFSDLSAVSWHQYYLNGRTATFEEFLDPRVFDLLTEQITAVTEVVRQFSADIPIWLSETSSAYGGGAPGLSDRFIAVFLWLDKLGLAAKMGVKVVIRQTLYRGYYSLIDNDLRPLPDFWISYFYKVLVGRNVLSVSFTKYKEEPHLRFYCHCLKRNNKINGNIVLYGMNMKNQSEYVVPGGIRGNHSVTALIFTAEHGNLTSTSILLNGHKLEFGSDKMLYENIINGTSTRMPLHIPPYSVVFWIFHGKREGPCQNE